MPRKPVPPKPAAPPRRAVRPRPKRRRWWWLVVVIVAIIVPLAGWIGWSEYNAPELIKAEAALARNDPLAALHFARTHLASRLYSRSANRIAALSLSKLGQVDEAETHYAKLGSLDRDDRHVRALALVQSNRRESAIAAYNELLADSPDDILALRRLAAVQISEKLWADALKTAERLIAIPDGRVIGHTLAGVVHHDRLDPDSAVVAFDRVLALDPEAKGMPLNPRAMFWADYGQDLLAVGRTIDAKKVLHQGLREGTNARIADLLGVAYYQLGANEEAEQYWKEALRLQPNRGETLWRIGRLELQRGKPADALEPLKRAVELEPKSVGPAYSLSLAYRRLGRIDEAEVLRKRADQLRAKSPPPSGGMGAMPPPIQNAKE